MRDYNGEQAVAIHKLKKLIEDVPRGKILALSGAACHRLTTINLHKAL